MRVECIDGKRNLNFGYCEVIEESDKFYGIYKEGKLLTHRQTWKQATKIASLIQEAFKNGYSHGYSQGYYDGGEW